MDAVWPFITLALILLGLVLQILWALRVMRALESSARSAEVRTHHLDAMRNAIIVIGRSIRGDPDPAPPVRPESPLNS